MRLAGRVSVRYPSKKDSCGMSILFALQHAVMMLRNMTHRSRVGGDGDTPQRGLRNDSPPSGLSLGDSLHEEVGSEQVLKVGLLAVSRGDVRQEDTLLVSNASLAPVDPP